MKFSVLFYLFLIYLTHSSTNAESDKMPAEQWKAYKTEHKKEYSDEEDVKRFEIFKESLKTIEEHNAKYAKGETTYKMGLNHMTDWYPEERNRLMGARAPK